MWWWGHWEVINSWGWALINGINAHLETPESSLSSPAVWANKKTAIIYEPGNGTLPNNESTGALILDFSAYKTVNR